MNIFYLDNNPELCAQWLGNKHTVKMVLETAQLLSTAHRVLDEIPKSSPLYRTTHVNHPCSLWVRKSNNNYNWTVLLFYYLCKEYTYRYDKVHKCEGLLYLFKVPPVNIPVDYFYPLPSCMPEEYKISTNPILNYRNYYANAKQHLHEWKRRNPPEWLRTYQGQ